MKNIIIAGPSRAGKSALASKLNEEFGYFVLGVDKLVAVFQEAYPQLDIRLNWDREKTTDHIAPFLGHFLGTFSSADGRGLLPYSHGAVKGNRFVLEGGYFYFEKILPILNTYGIDELKDNFILIGLVQNEKTVDEFVSDFKNYDTPDDWTYGFSDDDLRGIAEDAVLFSRKMTDHLTKYGFTIYDTSKERKRVFDQIIEDIQSHSV
ncbi:MAG TPA: hypothetical protein PK854_06190 [Oscillospiraceae bacterium]|nr:hypothetical protein [Oscillospiraceae bacterium]HPS34835.1 hypothetical protein [Oscillospiraceae bacterium]